MAQANPFWSVERIAAITGGTWHGVLPEALAVTGIAFDSRELQPGHVFVALKSEAADGHDYVDAVLAAGASFAIVSRNHVTFRQTEADGLLLAVDDPLTAMQALATAYRDDLAEAGCRVIAVAGSNGKTTTRHLLHHVLTHAEPTMRGTQSPKSFNNHIGVPFTLLHADPDDDFVLVEIGTNHPGEIAALSAIARPDAVVMTNIGEEHLEFFGDVAGVAQEEAAIFEFVKEGGAWVVPEHSPELATYLTAAAGRSSPILRFGFWPDPLPRLLGKHNRSNAAAAVKLAQWLGQSESSIQQALLTATGPARRLEVVELNQLTFIDDAYNANPNSMEAAIDVMAELAELDVQQDRSRRRVVILGDMLELGEVAADAHRAVADLIDDAAFDMDGPAADDDDHVAIHHVVFIGELMTRYAATALAEIWPSHRFESHPTWTDALPEYIAGGLREDDLVLMKASLGMGFLRLRQAIEARWASD